MANLLWATLRAECESRQATFRDSQALRSIIFEVAQFLTTDRVPKYGLQFAGRSGDGKTTMARCIFKLAKACTDHISPDFLRHHSFKGFTDRGQNLVEFVTATSIVSATVQNRGEGIPRLYFDAPVLIIDDVGRQATEVNIYGNLLNPLHEVLEHRCDRCRPTIITTNLTAEEVRASSSRLFSRFFEMFHTVMFENIDYRIEALNGK